MYRAVTAQYINKIIFISSEGNIACLYVFGVQGAEGNCLKMILAVSYNQNISVCTCKK